MLKLNPSFTILAFLLSIAGFSLAQDLAEKQPFTPVKKEVILKTISDILEQDVSQLKHPEKPMLWKIEGKDLKKPSYLFGSIHVADKNIVTLHPDAEAAYEQADTLATEVSMGVLNQLRAVKLMNRDDDQTLQAVIGDKLYSEVNAYLVSINPNLDAEQFKNMKTWAVILIINMIEEQLTNPGIALDASLEQRAANDGKTIWHLEKIREQLGSFDKLSEAEQTELLKDALLGLNLFKKADLNSLAMLKTLYLKGNTETMFETFELMTKIEGANYELAQKNYKLLLNDRNIRIYNKIQRIFKKMPEKSHFIVAGTLHYLGKGSVVELLQKQGYTVTKQ